MFAKVTTLFLLLTFIICPSRLMGHYDDGEDDDDEIEYRVPHHFLSEIVDENDIPPTNIIRYNYFVVHDINMDSKLDGLELIKAIQHHQEEDGYLANCSFSDEELIRFLDPLFENDDLNRDGFLNFGDYGFTFLSNSLGFFKILNGRRHYRHSPYVRSSECSL